MSGIRQLDFEISEISADGSLTATVSSSSPPETGFTVKGTIVKDSLIVNLEFVEFTTPPPSSYSRTKTNQMKVSLYGYFDVENSVLKNTVHLKLGSYQRYFEVSLVE